MIQHVKINSKEYPFKFGMREIYTFSNKQDVEFDEVDGKVSMDFDSFLELFHLASKKGAKKEGSDLVLTADEIEDVIDEDPDVFIALQKAFEKSKLIKELGKKAGKKPKAKKD